MHVLANSTSTSLEPRADLGRIMLSAFTEIAGKELYAFHYGILTMVSVCDLTTEVPTQAMQNIYLKKIHSKTTWRIQMINSGFFN